FSRDWSSDVCSSDLLFLLKTSPMLDISVGLSELRKVSEIHIVAVDNEVKELLWLMKNDAFAEPQIKTVNITKSGTESFTFRWNRSEERRVGKEGRTE